MRSAADNPHLQLETRHLLHCGDAADLTGVADGSVQLVVTSPPYPMITMWDEQFSAQSETVRSALAGARCNEAFESMHRVLDRTWQACHAALAEGGFLCVNIGDAVRTCAGEFRLYSNYARIVQAVTALGFTLLPSVVWRKPTNSPTKFLGSGMLPGGAYVTLEHEKVIICRKGTREVRSADERSRRRRSAVFWEERNEWYSDLWAFTGMRQDLGHNNGSGRRRSAAFPLELPFRLVCMYSWIGDTVCDPFSGTGTSTCAAIAAGRNSIGIDTDPSLVSKARERVCSSDTMAELQSRSRQRVVDHGRFIENRKQETKHRHSVSGCPVVTGQETEVTIPVPKNLRTEEKEIVCSYDLLVPGGTTGTTTSRS